VREPFRELAARALRHKLRSRFSRILLVGDLPALPRDLPLVVYANHHGFFDGHVLIHVLFEHLARRPIVWTVGIFPTLFMGAALAFPRSSVGRRATAVRRTQRLMRADPRTALVYFPEGLLHPADEGLLPVPPVRFERLDSILPRKCWVPVALAVGAWHEPRPWIKVAFGQPHRRPDGREMEALADLLRGPLADPRAPSRVLLDGGPLSRRVYRGARRLLGRA
jgi:1-acyl-sn-glycerol-3-phosphate acyltransferase